MRSVGVAVAQTFCVGDKLWASALRNRLSALAMKLGAGGIKVCAEGVVGVMPLALGGGHLSDKHHGRNPTLK